MKLIGFKKDRKSKVGILNDTKVTEIKCSMIEAVNSPNIDEIDTSNSYNINEIKICSPIKPSKIVCVGLNYTDHAKELNMDIPDEPIIFIKPSTAVIGHLDNIIYPKSSEQVDFEGELGIMISKKAHKVKYDYSREYVGGYTVINDITARDKQRKDIQWTRAKSFDTFAPIGPCIETKIDPMNLDISLKLNNTLKQSSNTKNMIFDVNELVEFISNIMTLNPGDIISTGTPPGVGPMKVGDNVEVEIEKIGVLKNILKSEEDY
jgi:2-keto-4-pentenoate hydratase/2-oxohepta-3-ene-1,7-dioic acid hydratase in catechol pathway